MRPVYQNKPTGCLQAAVASLLERPLDEVPDFAEIDDEEWHDEYTDFLRDLDLYPICIRLEDLREIEGELWHPEGYHLIIGESPRAPGKSHATVGYNGKIVHDPFENGEHIEPREYEIWVALLEHPALLS